MNQNDPGFWELMGPFFANARMSQVLRKAVKVEGTKRAIVSAEELQIWRDQGFQETGKTRGSYLEVEHA